MKLDKIYQKNDDNQCEIIYQLVSGLKVIKRNDNIVKKLNIKKWEVISFIPEDFQIIKRTITPEEEKELKKFIEQKINKNNNSYWKKIKEKIIKYLRLKK